jgi:Flp pilus assembly protein CpaB
MSDSIKRNRTRAALFATLSLILASGTAWVAWQVVSHYEGRLADVKGSVLDREVVVAAREIAAGHVLEAADLRVERRAVGSDVDALFERTEGLVGKVVGERVLTGEAVRRERLTSGGSGLRIDEVVQEGSRAITVRASRASAVGGLLVPGTFVDVIVTIRPDVQTLSAEWVTETILQGVRVLAVGDEVSLSPDDADDVRQNKERYAARETWVTLEVGPEEAEHLALGTARGQLHLTLRGRGDFEMMDPGTPLVTNALVGLPPPVVKVQATRLARQKSAAPPRPPAPPAAVLPATVTETIRGGKITTEQFDAAGNRIPADAGRR